MSFWIVTSVSARDYTVSLGWFSVNFISQIKEVAICRALLMLMLKTVYGSSTLIANAWNCQNLTVVIFRRHVLLIWIIFSVLLQVIGVISVFFIVVSIVSFCLKTHPDMRVPVIRNITVETSYNTTAWTLDKYQTSAHQAFFYVECICNAWFTIEIFMRFLSCPSRCVFLRSR